MFTTSDKAVLGMCGILTVAGLIVIGKAWKGVNEINQRGKKWKEIQDGLDRLKKALESKET
jgi:hypothetical protein